MISNKSGINYGFSRYVDITWTKFHEECQYNAGLDSFHRPLCYHEDNGSISMGERAGTKRCSIMSCPRAGEAYCQARQQQIDESSSRACLRVVGSS